MNIEEITLKIGNILKTDEGLLCPNSLADDIIQACIKEYYLVKKEGFKTRIVTYLCDYDFKGKEEMARAIISLLEEAK